MTELEWLDRFRRYETLQPGVTAWLRANAASPRDTVAAWGERFANIPTATLDDVLRRVSHGKLDPPNPWLCGPVLASYCERILMDDRKRREQQQLSAANRTTTSSAAADSWSSGDYYAVVVHYWRLARQLNLDQNPGLGPVSVRQRDWVAVQIIEAGLKPLDHDTRASYRERVDAAGIERMPRAAIPAMLRDVDAPTANDRRRAEYLGRAEGE